MSWNEGPSFFSFGGGWREGVFFFQVVFGVEGGQSTFHASFSFGAFWGALIVFFFG